MFTISCRVNCHISQPASQLNASQKAKSSLNWMCNLRCHQVGDVAHEETQDEANGAKGNADPVRPPIGERERFLSGGDDGWVGVAVDDQVAGGEDVLDFVELGGADELGDGDDQLPSCGGEGDDDELHAERLDGNMLGERIGGLVEEEVRVDCESDGAADVSDGQGDGRHGGDELVWACNLRDNGTGNDDCAHTERGNRQDGVNGAEIMRCRNAHGACSSRHDGGGNDHEHSNAALCDGDEQEADDSSGNDAETDGKSADADANGIITVDVVDLRGVDEKQHKEVATAQEGDEENDDHRLLCLMEESSRDHGMGCVEFPNEEGDDEDQTQDQRYDVVGAAPSILEIVSFIFWVLARLDPTCVAPHCMPIMKRVTPAVLRKPPR